MILSVSHNVTPNMLRILALNCYDLEIVAFDMDTTFDATHRHYLVNLLQNNQRLKSLRFIGLYDTYDFDLLSILGEFCPATVESCFLSSKGAFDVRHIVKLLLFNSKLKHCCIQKRSSGSINYFDESSVAKRVRCEAFKDLCLDHGLGHFFTHIFGFTHIELLCINLSDSFLRAIAAKNYSTTTHSAPPSLSPRPRPA
jgi:hypothetical protein